MVEVEVEVEGTSPANPHSAAAAAASASMCEECDSNESKYKCPGCSIRSCSLPCVKAHKKRTGCSGQRQKTQFLPISQFNDNVLISDYNLLEDVKRVTDSAQRMRVKLCGNFHFKVPRYLKCLQNASSRHRTRLLFLPPGMSKRVTNRTAYVSKKKTIFWTIEWRFHSTDVKLIDHSVPDTATFGSVIEKHLKPGPWSHCLKQFCLEPLKSLKFFIRKYPKGPRSPFRELDIDAPIHQQLANLVIVEYPVIHVFLPSESYGFQVIKEYVPRKMELKAVVDTHQSSSKGVFFKEEEIKDNNSPDPKVLDLKKRAKPDGVSSDPDETRQTKQKLSNTFECPNPNLPPAEVEDSVPVKKEQEECLHKAEDNELHWISNSTDIGDFDDFDFEFDDTLITDAIADDFFDLEDILPEDLILEGTLDHIDGINGVCPEYYAIWCLPSPKFFRQLEFPAGTELELPDTSISPVTVVSRLRRQR